MIKRYHAVMDSLSEAQSVMLALLIKVVRKEMYVGSKRLNWNSLGMCDLIYAQLSSVEIDVV